MRRIVVTGATGTIGSAVCRELLARGETPVALSRDAERARAKLGSGVESHAWRDPTADLPPAAAVDGADAVINLIGETVSQRWTPAAKSRIRDSRILATRQLVAAIRELPVGQRPAVLVSQSATGYYGACGAEELDEQAAPGTGFLAEVVVGWEAEAHRAEDLMRVARTRAGVVLASGSGALTKMLPFFRAGIGGPIASGKQYLPWIHLDDIVAGLLFCVDNTSISGPVNLTAPAPATSAEFAHALGRALRRPTILPTPELALRALFGEMAEIITTGQRAMPRRLVTAGYEFRWPELAAALHDVVA